MCQFLSRNMGGEKKSGKWHQETDQEEKEGRKMGGKILCQTKDEIREGKYHLTKLFIF